MAEKRPTITRTLRVLSLAVILMVLAGSASSSSGGAPVPLGEAGTDRPNVLIIVTDDQRARTLSVMPATKEWFVDGGTSFSNAFTVTPMCCPSRASIMTGNYPHNHGIRVHANVRRLDHKTTIQHHLQEVGYKTALVGKYLNRFGINNDPYYFDRWAVFHRYWDYEANIDGEVERHDDVYSTVFAGDVSTQLLQDFEDNDEQPWFMYVAPFAPHPPYIPESKYADAPIPEWAGNPAVDEKDKRDKFRWLRAGTETFEAALETRAKQLRTLMSVDDLVDRLSTTLSELGEESETLAVYVSDSGTMWGEHGLGGKRTPFTQGQQVPLMMRWPGRIAAGVQLNDLAASIDIAPTIADLIGIEPPERMDGRSLLRKKPRDLTLIEQWVDLDNQNAVGNETHWASLRSRSWIYTEFFRKGKTLFRDYYNLKEDPWQLQNLLGDRSPRNDPGPRRLKTLARRLDEARKCENKSCP